MVLTREYQPRYEDLGIHCPRCFELCTNDGIDEISARPRCVVCGWRGSVHRLQKEAN